MLAITNPLICLVELENTQKTLQHITTHKVDEERHGVKFTNEHHLKKNCGATETVSCVRIEIFIDIHLDLCLDNTWSV